MATFSFIHVEHPAGLRLLDLMGVEFDLTRCREMCQSIQTGTQGRTELDALAVAIPAVYGRVFLGGVRNLAKIPVEDFLDADEQAFHQQILHVRSKHAVHSINPMEKARLRVWLNPEERGGRKINSVNADLAMLMALSAAEYRRLEGICVKELQWLAGQKTQEENSLKQIIGEQFTLDELYARQAEAATSGGMESAAKGRKR